MTQNTLASDEQQKLAKKREVPDAKFDRLLSTTFWVSYNEE